MNGNDFSAAFDAEDAFCGAGGAPGEKSPILRRIVSGARRNSDLNSEL